MPDLEGATLGRYRILRQIGQGGMATVYEAFQPGLDRYVAIKVLPSYFAHERDFSERFWREVTSIAKLEHPNILPVYDSGEEDDTPYLVMKYVAGGTLKRLMGQPLPLAYTVRIISQIAGALSYAHERGIVHRDVKPANVLLAEQDWALLSDFGIAKIVSGTSNITKTGVGIGTPEYMAPEQGLGQADHRSDIYSLGIVLYEMVTGRPPFLADTPIAIILKHLGDPLPLPRAVNPDVPSAVERMILKALAKEPDDRYQSAKELAEALNQAAAPYLSSTPAAVDEGATPATADTFADGVWHQEETVQGERRNANSLRLAIVSGGAGVTLLLLALGGFFIARNFVPGGTGHGSSATAIVRGQDQLPSPTSTPLSVTPTASSAGSSSPRPATPTATMVQNSATPWPPGTAAATATSTTVPASATTVRATPTSPPTATRLPPSPTAEPPTATSAPSTPTPPPTNTPVPPVTYGAPQLLSPASGAGFSSTGASIILSWNLPQGLQGDNDWFHLVIGASDNHQWDVHHFAKSTSYQVGSYLCGTSSTFTWYIVPWRQTGAEPKDGVPAGAQSETRTFTWGGCGGSTGSDGSAPTPSGGLH